jgi:hypothetical protein
MKKLIISTALFLSVTALPVPALAADVLAPVCNDFSSSADKPSVCEDNTKQDIKGNSIYGPNGILSKAATILAIIVGIVCVIAIIIGGMRYILSGGDSQQTASAKNAILYAIIGLVITIAARSILVFVLGRIK